MDYGIHIPSRAQKNFIVDKTMVRTIKERGLDVKQARRMVQDRN